MIQEALLAQGRKYLPMTQEALFEPHTFGPEEKGQLDRDGHFILPGILTDNACARLVQSLSHIEELRTAGVKDPEAIRNAAEYDGYLESLIAHPQLLTLARAVLGEDIRFDHCVTLNRPVGYRGMRWHGHDYAEDDPRLGFIRIFFYVNGFEIGDGNLRALPGSHLFRDPGIDFHSEEEFVESWIADKKHPLSGESLQMVDLAAPPATVVLMWTHAAHAVRPRRSQNTTRWTVVYGYRNPGRPSRSRWITKRFEKRPIPGAEGLMSLY